MITRNMYAQSLDNVHSGEARLKVYFSIQSEQVNGIQTKYRNKCSLVNLLVVYCCDLSTTVTPFDLPSNLKNTMIYGERQRSRPIPLRISGSKPCS